MQMKRRPKYFVLTILAAVLALNLTITPNAHADWLKKLADAAADVGSFGEHGRQRDRERAEAREREARAAQEAAQRLKEEKIRSIQERVNTFTKMVKDFETVNQYLDGTHAELNKISQAALEVTANAHWWDKYALPRIQSMWSDESESEQQALEIIGHLLVQPSLLGKTNPHQEGTPINLQNESERMVRINTFAYETRESVHRLQELAKNNNQEMEDLLATVMKKVGVHQAELILVGIQKAKDSLLQTKAFTESFSTYYQKEVEKAQAELVAINTPPPPPPPAPPAPPPLPPQPRMHDSVWERGHMHRMIAY